VKVLQIGGAAECKISEWVGVCTNVQYLYSAIQSHARFIYMGFAVFLYEKR